MTDGFSRIWEEVRKQKDELMTKLGSVGSKQEQLMESQAQMDERLRQVRGSCLKLRGTCWWAKARAGGSGAWQRPS